MAEREGLLNGRLLVVAFEGWNDAGEAATGALRTLKELLPTETVVDVDPEEYFDFQFSRPIIKADDEGRRRLRWPHATLYGPADRGSGALETAAGPGAEPGSFPLGPASDRIYLLLGAEPSRKWKGFIRVMLDFIQAADIRTMIFLGSMLADVPHTRPISTFVFSENCEVRSELNIDRSSYEGPVGILSALSDAADRTGIATVAIWASVPHYVHNAPSPKAVLAILSKLEEILGVTIPPGTLKDDAVAWERNIDSLAGEDHEMASYIEQLERARDTVDSPEASGEAIAQEFERYLRRGDDGRSDEPWLGKDA